MIDIFIAPIASLSPTATRYEQFQQVSREGTLLSGGSTGLEIPLFDQSSAGLLIAPKLKITLDNSELRYTPRQGVFSSGNAALIELRQGATAIWSGVVDKVSTKLLDQTATITARHEIDKLNITSIAAGDNATPISLTDLVNETCSRAIAGFVPTTIDLGDGYLPTTDQRASTFLGKVFTAKRVGIIQQGGQYVLVSLDTPARTLTETIVADNVIGSPTIEYTDRQVANSVKYGVRTIDNGTVNIVDAVWNGVAQGAGGAQASRITYGLQQTSIDTSFLSPADALSSAMATLDARIFQRDLVKLTVDADAFPDIRLLDSMRVSYQYVSIHSFISDVLVYGIDSNVKDNTTTIKAVTWAQTV